jgi:dTDP-4-dehydrorhamnose 3,5-epimerase
VPRGFAHGFITMSDYAIVSYKVDYYKEKFERGIIYKDKILGINWKISSSNIILSKKDEKLPLFESYFKIND